MRILVAVRSGVPILESVAVLAHGCGLFECVVGEITDLDPADQASLVAAVGWKRNGQWLDGQRVLKLLPETHDPWDTLACTCVTHKNLFLESLGVDNVDADHAITMTQILHYFGITPIKTRLV